MNNDDVTKVKTAKHCAHQQWNSLFMIRDYRRNLVNNASTSSCNTKSSTQDANNDDDVFNCTNLIIPPSHELVNREVEWGIQRWKDLASRVIIEEDGNEQQQQPSSAMGYSSKTAQNDDNDGCDNYDNMKKNDAELLLDAATSGDKRKHRLLPYNFDYTCKKKKQKTSNSDECSNDGSGEKNEESSSGSIDALSGGSKHYNRHHRRPRVISLQDPTQTLDYESELWNVFHSVRTADELERVYALGSNKSEEVTNDSTQNNDTDGDDDNSSVPHGCKHTLAVKQNLVQWLKRYSRLDAHSLGRLRIRDRHSNPYRGGGGVPSSYPSTSLAAAAASTGSSPDATSTKTSSLLQTTIRFEILRHSQNLKRGSGSDGNRLEVEMHGSYHTLLDLHRLLVECSLNTRTSFMGGEDERQDDDGNNNNIHCPGVFFIENKFYTYGDAGDKIGEAIMRWLTEKEGSKSTTLQGKEMMVVGEELLATAASVDDDDDNETTMTPRKQYFGISPSSRMIMIPMSEMKLEDLPLRLGVRYYHTFVPPSSRSPMMDLRSNQNILSLANESAVYVTGIHTHRNNNHLSNNNSATTTLSKAPIIIHDTWASPQRHTCLACNYSLASVVTVNDPLTDAVPPSLDDASNLVHLQGVPMCSSCYHALHYKPVTSNDINREAGKKNDNIRIQPLLELRPGHQPSLVFPIEEYQRLVTASSLDELPNTAGFSMLS